MVGALATLSPSEAEHRPATCWLRLSNVNALLVVMTKWRHVLCGAWDNGLTRLLNGTVFSQLSAPWP